MFLAPVRFGARHLPDLKLSDEPSQFVCLMGKVVGGRR